MARNSGNVDRDPEGNHERKITAKEQVVRKTEG
jgi:hypothetical protein